MLPSLLAVWPFILRCFIEMMLAPSRIKICFLALIGTGIILLDQATKFYIDQSFALHESLPVIPSFFSITYVRNKGAAFGLFADQTGLFRTLFFPAVSVVALFFIATMFYQTLNQDRWQIAALSLILAGAIGNILDRIRIGEVIDFLDFYIGSYHWPAFNVADSAITVGVAVLMVCLLLEKKDVLS
jgi:signal peptidase II